MAANFVCARLGVLLPHPPPNSVAHVPIQLRELVLGVGAKAVEVPPSAQERIEVLEELRQAELQPVSPRQLLHLVAEVRHFCFGDFDSWGVPEAPVPSQTDSMSEEAESVGERRHQRLLRRKLQP